MDESQIIDFLENGAPEEEARPLTMEEALEILKGK